MAYGAYSASLGFSIRLIALDLYLANRWLSVGDLVLTIGPTTAPVEATVGITSIREAYDPLYIQIFSSFHVPDYLILLVNESADDSPINTAT